MRALALSKRDRRPAERLSCDHHAAEDEVRPLLELPEAVDQPALHESGRAPEQAARTTPTRLRPGTPGRPPAPAARVAGVHDRLRDRLQGRPRT